MGTWERLYEHVRALSEARQYRGQNDVKLQDLEKLADVAGFTVDPQGGMARVEHPFNPSIWTGWQASIGPAMAMATTDAARTVQTGNAQGGTVHKTNWGGKVVNIPAPIRPHHNDRLGSTMDRYDVIMVGDIMSERGAVLTRIAWSPAVGSSDERRARLDALLAGKIVPPLRRAQGQVPKPPQEPESPATIAQKTSAFKTDDPDGYNPGWSPNKK